MLFSKNDSRPNERILYQTKPNMILGCKKAIFGVVLLGIVLFVSPLIIKFIGEMQVYLISHIKLSLTRYTAIGLFVIILIIVIYIIWQLVAWNSIEYTLTDSRVIVKSGVLSTKKNYMPYATIQDVNTSQNIIAKLFNVGSVSIFSAYDNNLMELANISNPSKVEEIIFSNIVQPRGFQPQAPRVYQRDSFSQNSYYDDDYYDEFEPITPVTHENYSNPRREYEYYPEDFNLNDNPRHSYEYEPYGDEYEITRDKRPRGPSKGSYYNEIRDEYSYGGDEYYQNNDSELYYNDGVDEFVQNQPHNVDEMEDSPQGAIRRHFDKFKK